MMNDQITVVIEQPEQGFHSSASSYKGYQGSSINEKQTERYPTEESLPQTEEEKNDFRSKFSSLWSIGSVDSKDRVRFADTIRLIASICLLTSSVISNSSQDLKLANSLLYPFRSQWGFIVFLVLIGRAYVSKWILSQHKTSQTGEGKQESNLEQSTIREIGQSLLLRPFRFFLPIVIVQVLQMKFCQIAPAYSEGLSFILPSNQINGWCSQSSPATTYFAQIISLFTVNNQSSQLQQETGMLYMSPLLFQASMYAIGISTITHILRTNSRTIVLVLLAFFNWTTFSFLFPVMMGIIVTDLRVSGKLDFLFSKERDLSRFAIRSIARVGLMGIMIITLFVPQVREPLSNGLGSIQQNLNSDYQMIRFSDCISATLLIVLVESFTLTKTIFDWKVLAFLGKQFSASIVICHPLILYGILPMIFQPTLAYATQHSSTLLFHLWISTFFITLIFSIPFRVFVELVSLLIGKLFVSIFIPQTAVY